MSLLNRRCNIGASGTSSCRQGRVVVTIAGIVVVVMVLLLSVSTTSLATLISHAVIQPEIQLVDVDLHVSEDEHEPENRLAQNIKDTVEDLFRVRSNDVAALGATPRDRVEDPQNDDAARKDHVQFGDVSAHGPGVAEAGPHEVFEDEEQRDHGQGEVSPSVCVGDDGADEEEDDVDNLQQHGVQDGVPVDTCSEEKIHDDHG